MTAKKMGFKKGGTQIDAALEGAKKTAAALKREAAMVAAIRWIERRGHSCLNSAPWPES